VSGSSSASTRALWSVVSASLRYALACSLPFGIPNHPLRVVKNDSLVEDVSEELATGVETVAELGDGEPLLGYDMLCLRSKRTSPPCI